MTSASGGRVVSGARRAGGYGRTDRAVMLAGFLLLVVGAFGAVLEPLRGRPSGLVFALPLLFALGLFVVAWSRRRQGSASPISASIGLDGVTFLLGVSVLTGLLALTVYHRSDAAALGSQIVDQGSATATDCTHEASIGLDGFGGSWTCTASVTWDGESFGTVRIPHSQLTPADIEASVPVAAERTWYGSVRIVRDDGHPWALAGLLVGLPLGVLAVTLLLGMVFVSLRPIPPPTSPVGRRPGANGVPTAGQPTGNAPPPEQRAGPAQDGSTGADRVAAGDGTMVTAAVALRRIRDQRRSVPAEDVRAVPVGVITPELGRMRQAGMTLVTLGVLSAFLAWLADARVAIGVTVALLGWVVWWWSVRSQWRRLAEAARIRSHGPDAVDAVHSAQERARGRRRPLVQLIGIVLVFSALVLLVAVRWTWPAPLPTLSYLLAAGGLLAAALLLCWPVRQVDRDWRARLCEHFASPLPSVPPILLPMLSAREAAEAPRDCGPDAAAPPPEGSGEAG